MSKVMLVEDDNNLREIYEARLAAEGYEIVSAQDGEEALALAVKERPDLIIADIMMPKVSGFDMLDILRSTPETKGTKIIMMTALSQAEDKARAEKLGADKYLVKSQVTLEDVVKVAGEMLQDSSAVTKATDENLAASGAVVSQPSVAATPSGATASPVPVTEEPVAAPAQDQPAEDAAASTPPPTAEPPANDAPADTAADATAPATVLVTPAPDEKPAAKDEKPAEPEKPEATLPEPADTAAKTGAKPSAASKLSNTTAEEEAQISQQIEDFISKNPTLASSPVPPSESARAKSGKATSIPVTTPQENPANEDKAGSEADKTLATAVDSLVNQPQKTEKTEDTLPTAQQVPETAKAKERKGGERVIQPLSDPTTAGPDIEALLAKENDADNIAPPPANAVITPDGNTLTSASGGPAPVTPHDTTPGNVIAAPPSPEDPTHPNNIAL